MSISANMVKDLRQRTGCGIMECKQALKETDGDIEAAIAANVGEQVLLSSNKTIQSRASQVVKELRCLF